MDDLVANQLSVVRDDGGLLLASQPAFTNELRGWRAASPTGPWTRVAEPLATWTAPPGTSTYNALLHPHAGGDLASYNVNGSTSFSDATVYRPRFVRVVDSKP
jgi:hypothetical protein